MLRIATHYENLQVVETASPEVIKGAYKYLSQKWHPDRHPDRREQAERIMKMLNEAYGVLSNPQKRREHDDWIAEQRRLECAPGPPGNSPAARAKASPEPVLPWLKWRKSFVIFAAVAFVCVVFRGPHGSPAPPAAEPVPAAAGSGAISGADCQILSSRARRLSSTVVEISAAIRNNGKSGLVTANVNVDVSGSKRRGSRTMRIRQGETTTVRFRFANVVSGERVSYRLACSP